MLKKMLFTLALLILALSGVVMVFVPSVRVRVESIPLRLETWWREQQPHDLYVPPPAEVAIEPSPMSEVPSQHPNTQPTNQPIAQSSNRPVSQFPNRPISQPSSQPTNRPTPTSSVVAAP